MLTHLIAYGLRQVLGESAGELAVHVARRFGDGSQKLPRALSRANDRAWRALGVALAGDGLLDRVKRFFASGDDKGIREELHQFLAAGAIPFEGTPADLRGVCLGELQRARKSGLLNPEAERLDAAAVARQAADFHRYTDRQGLIDGARQAVAAVADALATDCPHLARLLRQPTPNGPPLLAAAFAHFFRREVETDAELARGLTFDGLQRLAAGQETAFDRLGQALGALGGRLDDLLGQTLERLGQVEEELRRLSEAVRGLLDRVGMRPGELRPPDSLAIHTDEERRAVKELLARFRQLSAEEQRQAPALLNGLGKLQVGAGDFAGARQTFAEAAGAATDVAGRAETLFNSYRAALEDRKWDDALRDLRAAAELEPRRFAPFPLHRYEPKAILGAGGFGTAVLCHDRHFDEEVVVKTLHGSDLERGLDEVFREARVLRRLSDPAIIGVRECDYADPAARARPYLVFDYFPGVTLEQFVEQRGVLTAEQLLAVAVQVARGLHAAHVQGVMHRDVKPANLLVRKEGDRWLVKIIDFGLALRRQTIETSAARASDDTILSRSVAGTVLYAPPEQMGRLRGVKVGPYSDVYSFGKTCCFALFRTTEPRSRHLATLSAGLRELLEKCIEHEVEHRPQSFAAVLEALATLDPGRQVQVEREQQEQAARPKQEVEATSPPQSPRQQTQATETPPLAQRKAGDAFVLKVHIPDPEHKPGEPLTLPVRIPDPEQRPGEIAILRWKPVQR